MLGNVLTPEYLQRLDDATFDALRNANAAEGWMIACEAMRRMQSRTMWLTAKDAARIYGLTAAQVRYAGKTGAVRVREDSPRKVYYSSDDLERIASAGRA